MQFRQVIAQLSAVVVLGSFAMACGGSSVSVESDDLVGKRFTALKTPSDPDLKALYDAADKIDGQYLGVYRFNKPGPEATDADAREKRIKEVMHRYMCSFFDESIDIGRSGGSIKDKVAATDSDIDFSSNGDDKTKEIAAFDDALGSVFKNSKLDVLSGGASGNNTAGEVMGVYDTAHNEILFYGFTNCGSDD